ncbi:MAG TPA: RNA polymerase sigma factor [Stellaceae bacterium]|nr:RNA polymerase sigma factor [Stellaceae bacterium]
MRAFGEALRAEMPAMRRYARKLCRGDRDVADDLVQSAAERAIEKQHLFRSGTNLRAWLLCIVHNTHCSDVRRALRAPDCLDLDVADGIGVAGPNQSDIGLAVRDLAAALDRIPPEQRRAVLAVGGDGLDYAAAAREFGVPIGTVRSRLFRGRAELRRIVERSIE